MVSNPIICLMLSHLQMSNPANFKLQMPSPGHEREVLSLTSTKHMADVPFIIASLILPLELTFELNYAHSILIILMIAYKTNDNYGSNTYHYILFFCLLHSGKVASISNFIWISLDALTEAQDGKPFCIGWSCIMYAIISNSKEYSKTS